MLGVAGISQMVRNPAVLAALNPWHGLAFLAHDPLLGFFILGSVFLAVTGGEALYADMGHFGVKPIRKAWFALVLPALVLNYFGQGALVLSNPSGGGQPVLPLSFFPAGRNLPMVVLAAVATVIASQAVISGAFSLDFAGCALGYTARACANAPAASSSRAQADLRAFHQLGAVHFRGGAGTGFPHLGQPGGGLRHRGGDDHGGDHHPRAAWWRAAPGAGAWDG